MHRSAQFATPRYRQWLVLATLAALTGLTGLTGLLAACSPATPSAVAPDTAMPMAVIGDSDSHAYQDRVWFPAGSSDRGGAQRAATLQWTEILARLRPAEIDPGRWGIWGTGGRLAQLRGWVGLPARAPRKQDFEYNFAWSGARCEDLFASRASQIPPLLRLMERDPGRWARGVVLIRIGINDLGIAEAMSAFAREGASAAQRQRVETCTRPIAAAVEAIAAQHPQTGIVLVGILDNADWARWLDRWRSPTELSNIAAALNLYDDALRALAAGHPQVRFFDDRAFFRAHWGGRGPAGAPAYRSVALGPYRVENTLGDGPPHGFLADGHSGTVWNALWAQALVAFLRAQFSAPVQAVSDEELLGLLRKLPS